MHSPYSPSVELLNDWLVRCPPPLPLASNKLAVWKKMSFSLSIDGTGFDMVLMKYQSKVFFWLHGAPFENVPVRENDSQTLISKKENPFFWS